MKKSVFGRKFKRDINARRALFRSLISSLILKERIQTTEAKAKAIKGDVDKLITKVKKNGDSRRLLSDFLFPHALDKLVNDIAPRFAKRSGGYTRILRIGKRFGDDASMVLMEWTEAPLPVEPKIKNEKLKMKNKGKKVKTKPKSSITPRTGSRAITKSKKKK